VDLWRLRLQQASFNLVRNARGDWSVANLIRESRIVSPAPGSTSSGPHAAGALIQEAEDTRINFIIGADKKPLAITALRARVEFDPTRRLLKYSLAGNPIRADLSLPSPGLLELEGEWMPGDDLQCPIDAILQTSGTLLYDWIPLVTGHNPGIYGVLDARIHLTGSIRVLTVAGEGRVEHLHPSDEVPQLDAASLTVFFRGGLDRNRGRALLEDADFAFANAHLHLAGLIDKVFSSPRLDLVLAVERSRLEDLLGFSRCLGARPAAFGISGRVDGLLSVQGPWRERRYGGFVSAKGVRLLTSAGTFPVSELVLQVDRGGARLAPARISLTPHVELVLQGAVERDAPPHVKSHSSRPPRYDLALSAKLVPLRDLFGFARAVGVRAAQNIDAQGIGTGSLRAAGTAWPFSRPQLAGRAELRAARLLIPGLTEPLNIPSASLEVNGDRFAATRVIAVMGTSVFSGRIEHQGGRKQPWEFDLHADSLRLEQGAQWFEALGLRKPVPLLQRLPGINSLSARRLAASKLFSGVNAKGQFSTLAITYRNVTLKDFRASIEMTGRTFRIENAKFKTGGGRAFGDAQVDLTSTLVRLASDVTLMDSNLQS
jgi:hypothetical protein